MGLFNVDFPKLGVPLNRGERDDMGIVKIMVPFWVPIIIRGLIRGLV